MGRFHRSTRWFLGLFRQCDNVDFSTNHEQPFCKKKYCLRKRPFSYNQPLYNYYIPINSPWIQMKHLPQTKKNILAEHLRMPTSAGTSFRLTVPPPSDFLPKFLRREPTGGCGGRELPGFRAGERLVTQGAAVRGQAISKKKGSIGTW